MRIPSRGLAEAKLHNLLPTQRDLRSAARGILRVEVRGGGYEAPRAATPDPWTLVRRSGLARGLDVRRTVSFLDLLLGFHMKSSQGRAPGLDDRLPIGFSL